MREHRSPAEEKELNQLEDDLIAGNQAFQSFIHQLTDHFAKVSAAGITAEKLEDTKAFSETLADLKHGAVAIYTLAGEDHLRTILITPTVRRAYEYP